MVERVIKIVLNLYPQKIQIMTLCFSHFAGDIFQIPQKKITEAISHIQVFMKSELNLKQFANQTVLVELSSRGITMKSSSEEILQAKIDFSLKFEVILQNEKNIKSRKIGFKIIKQGSSESFTFEFVDEKVSHRWFKELNQRMNQIGFHKRFKAIRKLGKGQFATVFQVQNLQTSQKFAVKAFSKNALKQNSSEKKMESLINQIKIMRTFKQKNLLKLEGVFESDNSIYLVLQLLKGGSLFERMQKLSKQKKRLSIDAVKQLMNGLVNGLTQLSQIRIAHRDIKLDNIVLRSLDTFQPVIIDFGLGTFVDDESYIYYRCGTAGFVSPEVMSSSKTQKIGPQSDMFSVGSVFHYLLTYKPLFEGKTTQQVLLKNKNCNIELGSQQYKLIDIFAMDLLIKMLEKNSQKRIRANQALMHEFLCSFSYKQSPYSTLTCEDVKQMEDRLNF